MWGRIYGRSRNKSRAAVPLVKSGTLALCMRTLERLNGCTTRPNHFYLSPCATTDSVECAALTGGYTCDVAGLDCVLGLVRAVGSALLLHQARAYRCFTGRCRLDQTDTRRARARPDRSSPWHVPART